jgi:hypothetical protein
MNWHSMLAPTGRSSVSVSPCRLKRWQRQATLDVLRGKGYGQSFCDHFGIQDYILQFERDPDRVIQYAQRYVTV